MHGAPIPSEFTSRLAPYYSGPEWYMDSRLWAFNTQFNLPEYEPTERSFKVPRINQTLFAVQQLFNRAVVFFDQEKIHALDSVKHDSTNFRQVFGKLIDEFAQSLAEHSSLDTNEPITQITLGSFRDWMSRFALSSKAPLLNQFHPCMTQWQVSQHRFLQVRYIGGFPWVSTLNKAINQRGLPITVPYWLTHWDYSFYQVADLKLISNCSPKFVKELESDPVNVLAKFGYQLMKRDPVQPLDLVVYRYRANAESSWVVVESGVCDERGDIWSKFSGDRHVTCHHLTTHPMAGGEYQHLVFRGYGLAHLSYTYFNEVQKLLTEDSGVSLEREITNLQAQMLGKCPEYSMAGELQRRKIAAVRPVDWLPLALSKNAVQAPSNPSWRVIAPPAESESPEEMVLLADRLFGLDINLDDIQGTPKKDEGDDVASAAGEVSTTNQLPGIADTPAPVLNQAPNRDKPKPKNRQNGRGQGSRQAKNSTRHSSKKKPKRHGRKK